MSDSKDDGGGLIAGGNTILRAYGLGGLILVIGAVCVGVTLYKAPDLTNVQSQQIFLIGGLVVGVAIIGLGLWLLRRVAQVTTPADTGAQAQPAARRHDVYVAAPMAGFGADVAGRKHAVELVNATCATLRRNGYPDVYMPALARPEPDEFESPATGFDVEWKELHDSHRYLLILPPALPPATSVLVTTGVAIALGLPCVILAHEQLPEVPYLVDGAGGSKQVKACAALSRHRAYRAHHRKRP